MEHSICYFDNSCLVNTYGWSIDQKDAEHVGFTLVGLAVFPIQTDLPMPKENQCRQFTRAQLGFD